jgi:hypothetical protein
LPRRLLCFRRLLREGGEKGIGEVEGLGQEDVILGKDVWPGWHEVLTALFQCTLKLLYRIDDLASFNSQSLQLTDWKLRTVDEELWRCNVLRWKPRSTLLRARPCLALWIDGHGFR